MHEGQSGDGEDDDWGLDWERYDSKRSETLEVKTRADGVERNAHTDLAIRFRGRVLNISLLLTEVALGAEWLLALHPRGVC